MIDLPGLAALGMSSLEWLALGWISGVSFPQPGATAANLALRVLVGASLIAITQLLLSLVGIGFGSIALVLVAAGLGATAIRLVRPDAGCLVKHVPLDVRERVGWALLLVVLLAALARSFLIPEAGWDAYSHWGLRAQAFAFAGAIVDAHSEHEYYPPLVPLLEAWLYLHRGAISIDLAKTVWAVVGSAFAVCLGWQLRLSLRSIWSSPLFALAIVLGTTALLDGFWTGEADLALTAYLTLATLAVWQWRQMPHRGWLIQAAIFGAAAALTKFEGLPRLGIVVLAVVIDGALGRDRRIWRPALTLAAAGILASLAWTAVEVTRSITPNGEHIGAFQPLAIGSVLLALAAVFGGVRTGGPLVVALLAWAVTGSRPLLGRLRPLTLVVIGQLLATFIAFLLSATAPELEVRTSATRLFEQLLPLALFVGAVGLTELHL